MTTFAAWLLTIIHHDQDEGGGSRVWLASRRVPVTNDRPRSNFHRKHPSRKSATAQRREELGFETRLIQRGDDAHGGCLGR